VCYCNWVTGVVRLLCVTVTG